MKWCMWFVSYEFKVTVLHDDAMYEGKQVVSNNKHVNSYATTLQLHSCCFTNSDSDACPSLYYTQRLFTKGAFI